MLQNARVRAKISKDLQGPLFRSRVPLRPLRFHSKTILYIPRCCISGSRGRVSAGIRRLEDDRRMCCKYRTLRDWSLVAGRVWVTRRQPVRAGHPRTPPSPVMRQARPIAEFTTLPNFAKLGTRSTVWCPTFRPVVDLGAIDKVRDRSFVTSSRRTNEISLLA